MRDRKGARLETAEGAPLEEAGLDFILRQEGADFFHETVQPCMILLNLKITWDMSV